MKVCSQVTKLKQLTEQSYFTEKEKEAEQYGRF
jgi:hypothetical protein